MTLRDKLKFWITLSNYIQLVVNGSSPLSLPDAYTGAGEDSLKYIKSFGGTEVRNVPEGYTELEYIQGNNNVQYINTGIVPTSSMEMYAKFQFVSVDASTPTQVAFFLGARDVSAISGIFFQEASATTSLDFFQSGIRWATSHTRAANDIVELKVKNALAQVFINGSSIGTNQFTPDETTQYPLFLNALNSVGQPFNTNVNVVNRVYRFTIANICDMIPAKRLVDNAIGMWDKIRKQFYTNAGTGSFVAGNAVTDPTPARPLDIWCNNGAVKAIRPLEYLESTGTQYIDTGFKPSNNTRILLDLEMGDLQGFIYGARKGSTSSDMCFLYAYTSGNKKNVRRGYASNNPILTASDELPYKRLLIDNNKRVLNIYEDDTVIITNTSSTATFETSVSLYLFSCNTNGSAGTLSAGKIYSCKIYEDGVLVRDFIPALDANNVPCMFDKVEGKCYYNAGTGQFIAPYLPAEYEQVEFIRSTGTQYIDTELQFTTYPFKKVITFSNVVQGSGASSLPNWVNGSWANDSNNRSGGIGLKTNSKIGLGIGTTGLGSSPYEIDNPTTPTTVTIEVLSSTSAKFTGGSTDYDSITYSGGALSGYTDYLFGAHYNGTTSLWAAGVKIYRAEYYDNGVHVADMIPVKKISTGEYGMYDLIRQQWFGNAGTGSFTCDADYTELEYIESTGTQYINTGFTVNQDTEVETEWQRTDITKAGFLYGIIRTGNTQVISAYLNTTNSVAWRFSSSSVNPVDNGFLDTDWHHTIQNKNGVTADGVLKAYSDMVNFQTTEVLPIFCRYNVSTSEFVNGSTVRMKYYTIRQSGTVVFNGIAAKRKSDNAIGMYDTVSKTFFMNAGTGTFTAGAEIPATPVAIPWMVDGTVEKVGIHSADNVNLFNGVFEQGVVYNGNYSNTTIRIRTAKPITLPAGTYTVSCASAYEMIFQINGVSVNTWYQTNTITLAATDELMICVRNKATPSGDILPTEPVNVQIEAGSIATAYSPYYDGGLATCENLFGISTTIDEQEILAGDVTRKVGICFFDGSENWAAGGNNTGVYTNFQNIIGHSFGTSVAVCSHSSFAGAEISIVNMSQNQFSLYANGNIAFKNANTTSTSNWKTFLKNQFDAGTPVIVVYTLATSTSESVAGQTLTVATGDNTAEIMQASIDGLTLEAKYIKGV